MCWRLRCPTDCTYEVRSATHTAVATAGVATEFINNGSMGYHNYRYPLISSTSYIVRTTTYSPGQLRFGEGYLTACLPIRTCSSLQLLIILISTENLSSFNTHLQLPQDLGAELRTTRCHLSLSLTGYHFHPYRTSSIESHTTVAWKIE